MTQKHLKISRPDSAHLNVEKVTLKKAGSTEMGLGAKQAHKLSIGERNTGDTRRGEDQTFTPSTPGMENPHEYQRGIIL